MASSKDFAKYVTEDLLREIDGVSARAMFGGFGLYKNAVIFGIIVENVIYLKVDDSNKVDYEEFGSKPFTYAMRNSKMSTMPYWELPESVMEDPEKLTKWVEKSVAINKAAKKIKIKKK
ncbi:MAG: TfoX/Sxy family protein [Patescibacteria group bacterium]